MKKAVFAVPFLSRPTEPFLQSLEACLPAVEEAGWRHGLTQFQGNPYISNARAVMTRKALDDGADVIVYLDYDISWRPEDMVKLLETEGMVVAGTYRFKQDEEEYMACLLPNLNNQLEIHPDGRIAAELAPAGFLKVTSEALSIFAKKHPHLLFGDLLKPHLDLFNHGVIEGAWWGEDYAFCKRWRETGNPLWIQSDLQIDHHSGDKVYKGNLKQYLLNYKE